MKEQVKKIQFWDVKEECSKYDINHNVRHTTKHVFIGQRWNVTSSDETNLMCQTQIKNRASFFKNWGQMCNSSVSIIPKAESNSQVVREWIYYEEELGKVESQY